MDWSREEVFELINYYKQCKCLWDTSCEEYNDTILKEREWYRIAKHCGKEVEDVKRKIKHLRAGYVAEKKKVDYAKERNQTYEPNLFYYKKFIFLDDVVFLRKSLPPQTSFIRRSFPSKKNHKIITQVDRKSLRDTKFNNAIDAIVASVTAPVPATENDYDDLFTCFGKTTALQLQQLPPQLATEAMSEIYNLVTKKTLEALKQKLN